MPPTTPGEGQEIQTPQVTPESPLTEAVEQVEHSLEAPDLTTPKDSPTLLDNSLPNVGHAGRIPQEYKTPMQGPLEEQTAQMIGEFHGDPNHVPTDEDYKLVQHPEATAAMERKIKLGEALRKLKVELDHAIATFDDIAQIDEVASKVQQAQNAFEKADDHVVDFAIDLEDVDQRKEANPDVPPTEVEAHYTAQQQEGDKIREQIYPRGQEPTLGDTSAGLRNPMGDLVTPRAPEATPAGATTFANKDGVIDFTPSQQPTDATEDTPQGEA